MTFSFTVRTSFGASDSALWDETHEGNPRVGVWGSWGRHRVITQARLPIDDSPTSAIPLGPFVLPRDQDYRGDEHLSFLVMASSHYSGDAILDAEQSRTVLRDIQIGMVAVPLRDIIAILRREATQRQQQTFHRVIVRQQHTNDSPAQNPNFEHDTYKGTLVMLFERGTSSKDFSTYRTPKPALRAGLLFGSPEQRQAEERMREILSTEHMRQFGANASGPDAWQPVDGDDGVAEFHITEWQSDVGNLPTVAYLQHEMDACRALLPNSDWQHHEKVYARTPQDAQLLDRSLRATWAASGCSVEDSIAAINAQLTQSPSDPSISPGFIVALRNVADFAREHATTMHYTHDYYYANHTLNTPHSIPPVDLSSTAARSTTAVTVEEVKEGEGTGEEPTETGSENWSTTPITGMANACDCDECGVVPYHVLELLASPQLRDLAATADTPLLRAVVRLMSIMVVFTGQGLVTTGFVNNSGERIAASQVKTLPLKGTIEFSKQSSSGHYWSMLMSRATARAMLEAAGHDVAHDLPDLAPHPAAYERRVPILLMEGTASSDLFILPAGEYAPLIFADAGLAEAYVEEERRRRRQLQMLHERAPTLFGQLKIYQPAQFVEKQADARQTLTPFYRYLTQMQSNMLYQMNPLYGHLKPVQRQARTHGVYIADLLRAAFDDGANGVGLRGIYAGLTREEWDRDIVPVMACLQNQLPMSIVARVSTPAAREVALRQQGHILSTGAVFALRDVPIADMTSALDRHADGMARHGRASSSTAAAPFSHTAIAATTMHATGDILPPFTAMHAHTALPAAAAQSGGTVSNTAPIIGYMEPWMLADKTRAAAMNRELDALHATGELEHIAWIRNRKLSHADDQITMRASLKL